MKMSRRSGGRSSRLDRAYNESPRKLLDNELAAGQLLHRRTLSQKFGMSVAPILKAVIQLEAEGCLETIPRKGTQAHVYGKQDLFEQIVRRGGPPDFAQFCWPPETGSGAEWR
ncbi:MAG: GntR family transcriptional regulator [Spirochaetaceae bacterium]|nr:MAG: GntR family transcriptional regulator [Spirochaetaceae bacterium]